MGIYSDIKTIFKKDRKLFLYVNVFYFGLVFVGALIALAYPEAQLFLFNSAGQAFSSGGGSPLSSVGEAYMSGSVLYAAAVTFITNFLMGTLLEITIPSLIVPVWALLMGAIRALLWGIMLVIPVPGLYPLANALPHYLTMLLEGEAYVVAIFAATRGAVALINPEAFGTGSRLKAYWKSIVDNAKLMLVVIALLAIAAIYEAWEVMYFAGILK